jgi:hypothetical protein
MVRKRCVSGPIIFLCELERRRDGALCSDKLKAGKRPVLAVDGQVQTENWS